MAEPPEPPRFREVKVIRTEDGLVGVISSRQLNGRETFTWSVRKEFDRDGKVVSTTWFQKPHFHSMRILVDQLEDELIVVEDKYRESLRRQTSQVQVSSPVQAPDPPEYPPGRKK